MNRIVAAVLTASAALAAPGTARAQQQPAQQQPAQGAGAPQPGEGAQGAQPNPPHDAQQDAQQGAQPNAQQGAAQAGQGGAQSGDVTIEITAPAPQQGAGAGQGAAGQGARGNGAVDDDDDDERVPQGMVPPLPQYPQPYGAYGPYPRYPVVEPPPPDTPTMISNSWSRRVALGGTVGVGSPIGTFGAWVDVNVSRVFGFTAGGGFGGTFGPAIAVMANVRPVTFGRWALHTAGGFSTNFTPPEYTTIPGLAAPSNSYWADVELGLEHRSRLGVLLRFAVGHALLLNTGDFTNREAGGWYGPRSNNPTGYDPVSAADAHDRGNAFSMFFVHLDVGGLFNF